MTADIVKTIAHELTFMSLGLLAGLVLVRTFLSWTSVLEIEGQWPWRRGLRRCQPDRRLTPPPGAGKGPTRPSGARPD